MSDDLIGRGVVEVVGNTDDVTAKIAKVGDDVEKMARRAQKAGKDASDGIKGIGAGATEATKGVGDATKKFEADIRKLITAQTSAKRGTEEWLRQQAKLKGADANSLEPLIRQYGSVKRQADEAAAATRRLGESQRFLRNLDSQASSIGKTASQLAALKAEQLGVAKEAAPMIAKMQAAEKAANGAGGAFGRLSGYVKATVAAFGVREIVRYADSWTELQNRLRLVTTSQQDLATATDDVYRIAKTTNQELAATGEVYQRFAQNANALGISQQKVAEVTETVSKAVAISGASAQAAQAALTQFGQALASGVLRGEEFNSVMEQTPGLAQAIARGMGVALGELRALAAEGKITGDVLIEALTNARESVDEQFNTRIVTLSQSFTNLRTSVARYIGELNTSTGVTSTFGKAIELLADNVKMIGTAATAAAAIFAGRFVASLVTANGGIMAIGRSAAAAATSITTFGRAGSIALGLLGGPVGLAVTAGLTATAFLAMGRDARAAYGDIDDLTGSLDKLNAAQIAYRKQQAEERHLSLQAEAQSISAELKAIEKDYADLLQMFEQGRGVDAEGLKNVNKTLVEQRARLADANQKIEESNAVLAQLDQAARTAAGGIVALNQAMHSDAGEKYLATLQGQIKSLQDGGDPIKIATRWVQEHADATEADKTAIMSAAHALKALQDARQKATKSTKASTSALSEAAKAAAAFRKEQDQSLRAQLASVSAIHEQAQALEDQALLYGASKTALEDLTIARLEEQAVLLRGFTGSQEQVEAIEREIEARQRLRTAMGSLEQKEAEKASWEEWARDVEQIFDRVGQSLTDAIFDGGKSGLDLLKDWAKTLTLRIFVQPVMSGLQAMVTGVGPGGIAAGGSAAGGLMGSPTSLFSMFGGNSMGMGISNALTGLSSSSMLAGTGVGNWMTGVAGNVAGMSNLALGGAGLLGGLGANLIFGGKGHSGIGGGLGSTVGMALGGPLGAVAGGLIGGGLGSLFGGREPTTRREQRTQVEYGGGIFDITKTDDRAPAGADAAARALAEQAVATANDIFKQVGVDAAIDSFHAIMASSYKGDRDGVASGGMLRLGDELRQFGIPKEGNTLHGFGGWSSAETLPRLATDIQLSVLEAFQSVSDELPNVLSGMLEGIDIRSLGEAEAQALAERFTMLTQGASQFLAAIDAMPFDHLRDLSFDAAAGLLEAAGGLQNLTGNLNTYYENFYSEAERLEITSNNIAKALGDVDLSMPDTRESFRALVEAQDLTTESGQRAYVALLEVSGAFAQVADASERAAEQMAQEAERKRQEYLDAQAEIQRRVSAERRNVIAARRAAEQAEREAFDAAVKLYEDGAKAFDELRQTLLSAGDAAGLLGATLERALSNPIGKYMAGGVDYDLPRWESDTTAEQFNFAYGVMQMRLARDLSNDVSANALRIENAGAALRDLSPNLGEYSPVVGPIAQALTAAVVDASGDMGYAVRDSVYQAMLGVAQQDVYSQFASQGAGLASIRAAQQQAQLASQVSYTPGFGMQYGADVGAYAAALDKLTGRMQSGQITADQFDAAVAKLNETMPTAAELLGDTEAQLQRMAAAAQAVAMAGARSIDHYFGQLRQMAVELEATVEPINKATAAIGRMSSWVSAFGESAQAAGDYSTRTGEAALIAQAAGIAASVLTTADARKAAEALAKDAAFAGVGGADLRDMALLVDGIRAFDPTSWESAFIRISDALGTGAITQDQYAALFNYSMDVFEDTARTTQQLEQSFDRLRDAAKSLADDLLLDRDLTTLSFGQQYAEAQRQYQEVMRRAMGGDVDAAADLDRVTRGFLERSADSRDEIQYRRDFAVAVNNLRQIEQSNPVVDEIKRLNSKIEGLNSEIEGLRAELRAANATVAGNTGDTTRLLRKIDTIGIKVQA